MGSDQISTALAPGDAYFESPKHAFEHQFNAGAAQLSAASAMTALLNCLSGPDLGGLVIQHCAACYRQLWYLEGVAPSELLWVTLGT